MWLNSISPFSLVGVGTQIKDVFELSIAWFISFVNVKFGRFLSTHFFFLQKKTCAKRKSFGNVFSPGFYLR
jgi:hypothetical protein